MKSINVKSSHSTSRRHVRFLTILERQGRIAYRMVIRAAMAEIMANMHSEKLIKSDDPKKERGWTGEIPQININIDGIVSSTLEKYFKALKWLMVGDYAGKDCKKEAKKLGFTEKFVPGLVPAAYLDALDKQIEHFVNVTGNNTENIPEYLVKASLEKVLDRANRYLRQMEVQLDNSFVNTIQNLQENANAKTTVSAIRNETEDATFYDQFSESSIIREMSRSAADFENIWNKNVSGEIGLSSAAATHQVMQEIAGSHDEDMRVIWLTDRDERVCSFCNNISMTPTGEFKYYRLSDFAPSGANIGRKRKDWLMCIPPSHPNCRCILVYVPSGFMVDSNGQIVKEI